jgi:spore coat protein U-like protein
MMRRTLIVLFFFLGSMRPLLAANTCSFPSVTTVAFGNYSAGLLDVTGTITVKCTSGQVYELSLSAGNGPGATVTTRAMQSGSNTLGYQLFSNAAYTLNWGNTSATGWVSATGTGANQIYTVYAQIPAGKFSPIASYTDTITATITGTGITTRTHNFTVTGKVVAACTLSAGNLNFGSYSGALINANSTISVTCTNNTTYNVGLNAGTATGATVTNRSMTGPSSTLLGYKLFSNSSLTTNWGNTVGTDTVAGTGSGAVQNLTVYGQMPAGQKPRVGSYADTITATVTY